MPSPNPNPKPRRSARAPEPLAATPFRPAAQQGAHAAHALHRRQLLGCCVGLAAGLFTGLGAATEPAPASALQPAPPDAGSTRELPSCARDLLAQAFDGLDPAQLWDVHAHLLGTGDSGSGCRIHPALTQWWHPAEYARRHVILQAAGVPTDAASIDRAFVDRLAQLAGDFPAGARWLLFAFEQAHDDQGRPRPDWSTFHVPDAHAAAVARAHPSRFAWVASIHPYRDDAVERLEAAAVDGALAVKWLPSAMGIDLRDRRCRPFYEALQRLGLPLVVHAGEEHAVPGAGRAELGNPLHARAALEAGATVILAHCASLGAAEDSDARSRRRVPAFELFARLMDERAHGAQLFGDVSAVCQVNRRAAVWRALLRRDDWHRRLLHGSDHPLPGVVPLVSLQRLAHAGVLARKDLPALQALRAHNPLLFDLVLKRRLNQGGAAFASAVFHTCRAFPRAAIHRSPVSPGDTGRRAG